jgi:hypothetical protein
MSWIIRPNRVRRNLSSRRARLNWCAWVWRPTHDRRPRLAGAGSSGATPRRCVWPARPTSPTRDGTLPSTISGSVIAQAGQKEDSASEPAGNLANVCLDQETEKTMSRLFGSMRQVGIVVRDIEKARRHWAEVCGCQRCRHRDGHTLTVRIASA